VSVIIVEDGDSDESTAETVEEVSEVATEVAEAVSDAIVDAVEAIVEATDSEADTETLAVLTGVTLEQVSALTDRVDGLESRVTLLEYVPEPEPEAVVDVVEETAPEPDEPPSTRKSRLNTWWFGS